jgi:LmbE family N-acetylglucosaminyl deacetylase
VPVPTIVFLHAHPDDETSQTGGSIARAAAEGHRVVVVFATGGEHGEVPADLAAGESLADRRRREAEAAGQVLGTSRIAWLGYSDSGMTGWDQNEHATAFAQADLDEAAGRLVAILDEEDADVLVGYDWHGGYGHPDHVQVHRVVHRAAELARRRPRLFEATMNRDRIRAMMAAARAAGMGADGPDDWDPDAPMDDGNPLGTPEAQITWSVDVSGYVGRKRDALTCHASQATDVGNFLAAPPDAFAMMFGTEYLIEPGVPVAGMRPGWLVD